MTPSPAYHRAVVSPPSAAIERAAYFLVRSAVLVTGPFAVLTLLGVIRAS
jgi:hypothetical protein